MVLNLRRDFELQTKVMLRLLQTLETFKIGLKAFLCYDMATSHWGVRAWNVVV